MLSLLTMKTKETQSSGSADKTAPKTAADSVEQSPPVLCYVEGQWAYFTTRKLSDQWGDDWDDAPYEHNAGTPYDYGEHDRKEGREPWRIIKVAWDGYFDEPSKGFQNSHWSVEQINAGAVAWLRKSQWLKGKPVVIPAGTPLDRFCELIREGGGTVYLATGEH